jgi:hypothetical protein
MSSEQSGAVRRCWAADAKMGGVADWVRPKLGVWVRS